MPIVWSHATHAHCSTHKSNTGFISMPAVIATWSEGLSINQPVHTVTYNYKQLMSEPKPVSTLYIGCYAYFQLPAKKSNVKVAEKCHHIKGAAR